MCTSPLGWFLICRNKALQECLVLWCFAQGCCQKHDITHNTSPAEKILASSEPVWSIFSNTIVNCVTKIGSWIYIVSRTMLIMINGDNKKIGKAWKCENIKDSFRFTWCNCWFKDGCSFWIWIASFILSWKPVEACVIQNMEVICWTQGTLSRDDASNALYIN